MAEFGISNFEGCHTLIFALIVDGVDFVSSFSLCGCMRMSARLHVFGDILVFVFGLLANCDMFRWLALSFGQCQMQSYHHRRAWCKSGIPDLLRPLDILVSFTKKMQLQTPERIISDDFR